MAKIPFRWRVAIEQPSPPPISFETIKAALNRHIAIQVKAAGAVTTTYVEFPDKGQALAALPDIKAKFPSAQCGIEPIPCYFCGGHDINPKCHVVSDFMVQYHMDNVIDRTIMYDRDNRPFAHTMIAPPYFCHRCEHNTFSDKWEKPFSQTVFPDPMNAGNEWSKDGNLGFVMLSCYRYAVHCLVVDNDPANQPIGFKFRDLAFDALHDLNEVGKSIFVYPWVYRPIVKDTKLKPRINSLLSLGFGDKYLLAHDGLPDLYLIKLPKMLLLFSTADLTATGKPEYANLVQLKWKQPFDPKTANVELPELFSGTLNSILLKTENDQTGKNEWLSYVDPKDEAANPGRMMYTAREFDKALLAWHTEQKKQ